MAMKIDRRAFLKTSAAMAVAVSMTGLLGGCSDSDIGPIWVALRLLWVNGAPSLMIRALAPGNPGMPISR